MSVEKGIKQRLNAYRVRTKKLLGHLPDNVVDVEYLEDLWDEQGGRCHYFDIPITLLDDGKQLNSAHLDKIEPARGYVRENVVWTSRVANLGRNNTPYDEFLAFSRFTLGKGNNG